MAELLGVPVRTEPATEPRFPEPRFTKSPPITAPAPKASMAELMGTAPTAPAPASRPMPESARVEPSVDPELSLATEMAERAARSVAEEGSMLGSLIEVRARPAALWQRITAFIVDGALVGGVLALYIGLAAALISPHAAPTNQLTGIDGTMARVHQLSSVLAPCVALALVLGLAYTAAFALLWNGRTPGRRLLGIRLVDRTGLAPTPGRAITRAALSVLSFVPFLAGFWLALFDRRGQTLHDKLTQTFVVRPG
jgi:uncharacterized RDD family membrane protein YckC